jgi:D-inositol-3-phosphate glycosyltransferase
MKKNITMVVDRYYPSIGGAQKLVKTISEELIDKFNISIITKKLKNTKKYEIYNGVEIHRIFSPGRPFFDFFIILNLLFNAKLRRVIKKSNILHGFGLFSPRATSIVSKIYKKPCVLTIHEYLGKRWFKIFGKLKGVPYYIFESSLLWFNYDFIIAVSNSTKNDILGGMKNKNSKVIRIYPFVEIDDKCIKRKKIVNQLIFINYGRPGITKGISNLINAFDKFNKKDNNSKLILVLNREPKNNRKKIDKLTELIKNKNIIIKDSLPYPKLLEEIEKSDIVVVPSLTEGFGFTAAEASLLGKPVLATTAGSLPEVIPHNLTGILVEPFSVRELVKGLKEISKKQNIKKFSDNSKKYIKRFSKERTISSHIKLYNKILKNEN